VASSALCVTTSTPTQHARSPQDSRRHFSNAYKKQFTMVRILEFFGKIKSCFAIGSTRQRSFLMFLLAVDLIFLAPTILYSIAVLIELIYPIDTTGMAIGFGLIYVVIGTILFLLCLIPTGLYINRLLTFHKDPAAITKKNALNSFINILILLFFLALFAYPLIRSILRDR